ncbi:ABC transporter ATP-binding protein [Paenibacillus larvae]|uniref:SkfA peptide export ATP-binding protein SkfE n=2 Tax=Paenibacillus larvae TaxID=1464 RepID=V9W093_9BACL|nr:ABC transporter ATP-binding protein [Paenibacillus larvae]AHD04311.1 SkfA peptide export ATP-binding protein SkfE [Paenibacillus larvae subsp. larvae DSM 25430]AQR78445.1 multidrug ABC transporter ATP-binding protein [Paenibacillus larvae subsp. larvae]AVF20310.1 SkfA peptide export ATP-binding protein SkfE [Paenibacillus larvae subsp. larvae]AVG10915.1 SkfA peptide export ATP-binding protein SkfE [Paenibacillus larvae subsp. larvae DSM 25430]ETK28759.1 SkfA peptide export ATP-binding prote
MLTVNNLEKRYSNGDGVHNISFSVEAGEIVGLLGANGAGKTTTLRCITGLYLPDTGDIRIRGAYPGSVEAQKATAFIPDTPYLYPTLTVAEHLQFKAKAFGTAKEHLEDKVYHVLEEVGLEKFSDRLSGNLSKGQKQRVMLAAAILQEADLIIFDEPTVGLDIPSKQWLAHWIKKNAMDKRSILISSHSLDFVIETTYRVILIEQGELKSSKPVPKGKAELQAWCNGIIEELGGVLDSHE